jgi:hypothetical protein
MQYVSVEELKLLTEGKELVYVLEELLMEDVLAVYDNTGKVIWYIWDKDTLLDGLDILEEKLNEMEDEQLILEYYYKWSYAQFYFCNDRLRQVKVKVYMIDDGYRIEKFHDDGFYEVEKVINEKKLLEQMGWHGYGRVLYFTYIDNEIPHEIMQWIKERGSWAKILVKEPV